MGLFSPRLTPPVLPLPHHTHFLISFAQASSPSILITIYQINLIYYPLFAWHSPAELLQFQLMKPTSSKHPLCLPHIRPAKSLPNIPPFRQFDLRCVNQPMQPYNPNQDKFLSHFFQRQNRIRALSSDHRQATLKTEQTSPQPNNQADRANRQRKKKMLTEQSRVETVKQLSRQDFNNYLECMRQKVAGKQHK